MNIKYIGEQTLAYLIEKIKATFALVSHTHTAEEIGADKAGSASMALVLAEQYTDEQLATITTGDVVVKESEHATSADNATHSSTSDTATNANHATSADEAAYAIKAEKDAAGNVITGTYETKTDAAKKLAEAKSYTDTAVSNLVNSAPETLDTLGELATALKENEGVVDALDSAIGNKADVGHKHEIADINTLQDTLDGINEFIGEVNEWSVIYDSGEITESVNAFADIDITGYKKFMIVVKCVNADSSFTSKNGSVTFTATNGTMYQFPVWTSMFMSSYGTANMAKFEVTDNWLICSEASRMLKATNFLSSSEGGTVDNLTPTGSGVARCTKTLSTMMISAIDQNVNYYFQPGSRVIVWGGVC